MEREAAALNKLKQIYTVGIASFFDRIRDKSTIFITLFMMYVTYLFFPENNTSIYYTLNMHKNGFFYRGIYNSVWMGWAGSVAFISIISLIGFYFINNSIKKERELKIGEISASMSIKPPTFIFGKTLGNFIFLLVQILIVILMTAIMQLIRGESYYVNIIEIMKPFLIFGVPTCLIVSVLGVTFEVIPFLSGTIGNIIYFFTWTGLIAVSISESFSKDVFGIGTIFCGIVGQMKMNFKELQDADGIGLGNSGRIYNNVKTFVMNKSDIKSYVLMGRFFWIAAAFILLILVSFIFRRSLLLQKKFYGGNRKAQKETLYKHGYEKRNTVLTPLPQSKAYSNSLSMLNNGLKIIVKSLPNWWYILAAAVYICTVMSRGEIQNKIFIPLIWILPITIWSKSGTEEKKFNMEAYLFTCNNYRNFELMNSFISCFLLTVLVNTCIIIKFILAGNAIGALYILMAAFFVSSLGIFIGSVTGSSAAFEIIYLLLWYAGILNGFPALNFIGISKRCCSTNIPCLFFMIGLILLITSMIIKNSKILVGDTH